MARRKKRPKSIILPTGRYYIMYRRLCGVCFVPGEVLKGEIIVDPSQSEQGIMATIIHEGIHGILPHLKHKDVYKLDKYLTRLLWKTGYRMK